jgi:hypothetical protein
MLKNLKIQISTKYMIIVAVVEILRLGQNCIPRVRRAGNRRKNTSDGNTSQNIDWERLAIVSSLAFSTCNHRMASREVSGREAMRAPKKELRLATSLTRTTTIAEIPTFTM